LIRITTQGSGVQIPFSEPDSHPLIFELPLYGIRSQPKCFFREIHSVLASHLARANKPNSVLLLCFRQRKQDWLPKQSSNCPISTNCFAFFFIWNKSDQVYGDEGACL